MTHLLTLVKKLIKNIQNLRFVIFLEYQNVKTFLEKVTLQVGLIIKVKNTVSLLVILKVKKFLEYFMKTNCKKQIKKSL